MPRISDPLVFLWSTLGVQSPSVHAPPETRKPMSRFFSCNESVVTCAELFFPSNSSSSAANSCYRNVGLQMADFWKNTRSLMLIDQGVHVLSCDTIFSIVYTIPAPRFITILNSSTAIICVSFAPLIPFRDPSVPSASYPGETAQHASWNTFPLHHRSKRSLRQLGGWQKGFQLFLLLLGRQDFFLTRETKKKNKREVGLQNWSSISQRS